MLIVMVVLREAWGIAPEFAPKSPEKGNREPQMPGQTGHTSHHDPIVRQRPAQPRQPWPHPMATSSTKPSHHLGGQKRSLGVPRVVVLRHCNEDGHQDDPRAQAS